MLNQRYSDNKASVNWQGYDVNNNTAYVNFMVNEVNERLNDENFGIEIEGHLRGLAITDFEIENIEELLNASTPEEKAWAVGEAFAEAILERENGVIFPWNQKRDLRNENSSLSGADLIGLIEDDGQLKLLIGEVKTSEENSYPPSVMYGAEGMIEQLKAYHTNRTRQITIIKWLLSRCKNTDYEEQLNEAIKFFISNGNTGIYLAGVLVRSSVIANEMDLKNRGIDLSATLSGSTKGHLQAFYLPITLNCFVALVMGGDQ